MEMIGVIMREDIIIYDMKVVSFFLMVIIL